VDPTNKLKETRLSKIRKRNPTGVIMRELRRNEQILSLNLPTVISTWRHEKIPEIPDLYVDNVAIGEMAAEHLLERGFEDFAFCGMDEFFWSNQRRQGFTDRIARAGFDVIAYGRPRSGRRRSWENEQSLLADWIKSLPRPVGMMACIDERAQDIAEVAKLVGLRIPEDIAVVGCDNDELICDLSYPPLSSVELNAEKAGYEAAELLHRMMTGEEKMGDHSIPVKPSRVVKRLSTDICAVEDADVAAALHFIRKHAREAIQVEDVARAVALSRHGLYKRFQTLLNRSVQEEIRRTRVEQICISLLETKLSVSRIASDFGYGGPEHLARYFKQQKGMTPL